MIIAIDGTLASGKGTLARGLADDFKLPHLDTGLLYRGVAKLCLERGIDPEDPEACGETAKDLDPGHMDPTALRTAEVGQMASKIAVHPAVREALYQLQRDFAFQPGGAVLDGRDIGTVVCPEAHVKFWVDADIRVRAERRTSELVAKGEDMTVERMLAQLEERDRRDRERATAPMKPAEDAHLLDTSELSIDAAREKARQIADPVRAHLARSQSASQS